MNRNLPSDVRNLRYWVIQVERYFRVTRVESEMLEFLIQFLYFNKMTLDIYLNASEISNMQMRASTSRRQVLE